MNVLDKSRPAPRAVVSRKMLQGGIYISIRPQQKLNKYKTPEGEAYDQFGQPMRGGYLNFHVFGKHELHGKRIWAEAQVWAKTMDDGQVFIYIDLRPIPAGQNITHEMKIYQQSLPDKATLPRGTFLFECPGTIQGSIGFLPIQH